LKKLWGHRTFVTGGIEYHFIKCHFGILAHRENRIIDKQQADRTTGTGFKLIALIKGIAGFKLILDPIRANNGYAAFDGFCFTDGGCLGMCRGLLGSCHAYLCF